MEPPMVMSATIRSKVIGSRINGSASTRALTVSSEKGPLRSTWSWPEPARPSGRIVDPTQALTIGPISEKTAGLAAIDHDGLQVPSVRAPCQRAFDWPIARFCASKSRNPSPVRATSTTPETGTPGVPPRSTRSAVPFPAGNDRPFHRPSALRSIIAASPADSILRLSRKPVSERPSPSR
jgi:hypothetical protein